MPDIFRGIHLDPLVPSNSFYLLWMILGYLVVTSVLIVSLGRLGDMFGRVRIYNLGFVIYTVASLLLTIDWLTGRAGATTSSSSASCRESAAPVCSRTPPRSHRRVPGQPTRDGARHQQHRRGQRHVRRARPRRSARADRLAPRVPHLRPGGPVRHGLGLPQAPGALGAAAPSGRLAGQRHLRRGPRVRDGGDHLRDPPLRAPRDRLEQPAGARPVRRRDRCA